MKDLTSVLEDIVNRHFVWDYYGNIHNQFSNFDDIVKRPKDFLKSYLKLGGKLSDMQENFFETLDLKAQDRLIHTIAIFFLGIAVYKNCNIVKNKIDGYIYSIEPKIKDKNEKTPFCYYWFLICFFHDIGYIFEKMDSDNFINTIKVLKVSLPFDLPEEKNGMVPRQIIDNWKKYFNYRKMEMGSFDHGIVGGNLFYTDMYRQYEKKKRENGGKDTFIDNEGRFWSPSIVENIFLSCAWAIIAHNMRFLHPTDKNAKNYKRYDLHSQLVDKPVISLEKHPILYLLAIVDSIDPVKFCLKVGEKDINKILSHIQCDFSDASIMVCFNFDRLLNDKYAEIYQDLETWLVIKEKHTGFTEQLEFT